MPQGVEHENPDRIPCVGSACPNLRCRKALSTCIVADQTACDNDVSKPPMPQGVEHCKCSSRLSCLIDVSKPPMPQGVEHDEFESTTSNYVYVSKPPMPQGVEHRWRGYSSDRRTTGHVSKPPMPQGVEHNRALSSATLQSGVQTSDAARR